MPRQLANNVTLQLFRAGLPVDTGVVVRSFRVDAVINNVVSTHIGTDEDDDTPIMKGYEGEITFTHANENLHDLRRAYEAATRNDTPFPLAIKRVLNFPNGVQRQELYQEITVLSWSSSGQGDQAVEDTVRWKSNRLSLG